jgi:ring-1,2-phenylacetyl-CoA epoxidase subunit PaaE
MTQLADPPARAARPTYHPLTVAGVRAITDDALEVTLQIPPELAASYQALPGQNLPVRATIDGYELRRQYSICARPAPDQLTVAIKKAPGGVFSTWVHDHLVAVGTLDAMPPEGRFTVLPALASPTPGVARHFAALAAGSGITPVIELIRSQLGANEVDTFTLVYSNKTTLDTMFVDELADLKDRYPTRLALFHVLTREVRNSELLSGRLAGQHLHDVLAGLTRPTTMDQWFLCGPKELVEEARTTLTDLGVDPSTITFELFTTGNRPEAFKDFAPPVIAPGSDVHTIKFKLDGTTNTVLTPVNSQEPVLFAALRVRSDTPYSCTGGICGTCRARVIEGEVEVREQYALQPDELAAGLIPTCQSIPVTPTLVIDYDTL